MTTFVFMHVGADPVVAYLVLSIRMRMPSAQVVQCSDAATPAAPGVDRVFRHDGDARRLMTFRMEAFAALGLSAPAVYLDSDMLLLSPPPVDALLGGNDAVLCRRSSGRDEPFNTHLRGLDFSEYEGMTMDEVYPYLACFTVARDAGFWARCRDVLAALDPKFHLWYGDQEALRRVAQDPGVRCSAVEERLSACLPEAAGGGNEPWLLHFKGERRKALMRELGAKLLVRL